MQKIVFNNNYAQHAFTGLVNAGLTDRNYGSYHAKYILSNFQFVNSEFLDWVKRVNAWLLDKDNARVLFDPEWRFTYTDEDGNEQERAITKNELYGFGFLFDATRASHMLEDDWISAHYQLWIDVGLLADKDDLAALQTILSRVRWLNIYTIKPRNNIDGSYTYEVTTPIPLNKTWKAEDDNPDDNQMYIFRWFNAYDGYGNYTQTRTSSKESTPFVAFRDLSNEDEEVYIKQMAWCAWTVGTEGSEADIEVDFLDEVDYFDSLSIRMMPPYVIA